MGVALAAVEGHQLCIRILEVERCAADEQWALILGGLVDGSPEGGDPERGGDIDVDTRIEDEGEGCTRFVRLDDVGDAFDVLCDSLHEFEAFLTWTEVRQVVLPCQ